MIKNHNQNNNRIHFIDQCKGIGIILMVYGHCTTSDFLGRNNGLELFSCFFTSFHMPLFFIIGGFLLAYKNEPFNMSRTLVKKAKQLLLPGYIFSIISLVLYGTVKAFTHQDFLPYIKEYVFDIIKLNFPDAMWFLVCYFFSEIIFLVLIAHRNSRKAIVIIAFVSFICEMIVDSYFPSFVRVSRLLMAVVLISIGYLFYQLCYPKNNSPNDKTNTIFSPKNSTISTRFLLPFVGVLLLIITYYSSSINGQVSLASADFGQNIILFVINSLTGSFGIIFIFIAINHCLSVLEFFGKNSLIVLCTHMFIINFFWMVNGHFLQIELKNLNSAIIAICVLIIEVPIIYIINTFFPFLIGQKKPTKTKSNDTDKSNLV